MGRHWEKQPWTGVVGAVWHHRALLAKQSYTTSRRIPSATTRSGLFPTVLFSVFQKALLASDA
jgi:hypothetical protein